MSRKKPRGRPPGKKLSPAELAQRKAAAEKSTGPKTAEGKAASSMNAWKSGRYAETILRGPAMQPCKSTCPKYPCQHIDEGNAKPGQRCLDTSALIQAYDAIIGAMTSGEMTGMVEVAAANLAANLTVIQRLREEIHESGPMVTRMLYGKSGELIGEEKVLHPGVLALPKLCQQLGIDLPQFLATPAARAGLKLKEEEFETAAEIAARLIDRFGPSGPAASKRNAIDVEVVKDD